MVIQTTADEDMEDSQQDLGLAVSSNTRKELLREGQHAMQNVDSHSSPSSASPARSNGAYSRRRQEAGVFGREEDMEVSRGVYQSNSRGREIPNLGLGEFIDRLSDDEDQYADECGIRSPPATVEYPGRGSSRAGRALQEDSSAFSSPRVPWRDVDQQESRPEIAPRTGTSRPFDSMSDPEPVWEARRRRDETSYSSGDVDPPTALFQPEPGTGEEVIPGDQQLRSASSLSAPHDTGLRQRRGGNEPFSPHPNINSSPMIAPPGTSTSAIDYEDQRGAGMPTTML